MKVQALRRHTSRHGHHAPGDVYEENVQEANEKIDRGLVKAVQEEKKAPAPENKKAVEPENKGKKASEAK